MHTFNKKLKDFRISNKLSQAEFAEKTGVSRGYIQQIEKGVKFPSNKYISNIETIFKLPKGYFIKEKNIEKQSSDKYILLEGGIVKTIEFDKERSLLTKELDFFYNRIVDLMMISKELNIIGVHAEINDRLDLFSNIQHKYLDERLGVLHLVGDSFDLIDTFENMSNENKIEYLNNLFETSKIFENSFFVFFNEIYNNLLKSYHKKS